MRLASGWISLLAGQLAFTLLFSIILVGGYFTYQKLTYPGYSCGSFALIDDRIGWVLKPRASSCVGGREPLSSAPPWFEATVYTDDNGFRSGRAGGPTREGSLMAVGDSWVFGFGIAYEDTFAAQLEKRFSLPTTIVASPAYSTAQSLLLAERWADRLRPPAIVFYDTGSWGRAACRGGSRPTAIQKPCYWQAPGAAEAELVLPPAGHVARMANWGILPGGILGAGDMSWSYFLISRPYALVHQPLVRLGLASGFANDFLGVGVNEAAIQKATLQHAARLAAQAQSPLLLIDPLDIYEKFLPELPPEQQAQLHRVGRAEWNTEILNRTTGMNPADIRVPNDNHHGPGVHRLIAELIAGKLAALNVTTAKTAR